MTGENYALIPSPMKFIKFTDALAPGFHLMQSGSISGVGNPLTILLIGPGPRSDPETEKTVANGPRKPDGDETRLRK